MEKLHQKKKKTTESSRNKRKLTITIVIIFRDILEDNTLLKQEQDAVSRKSRPAPQNTLRN